jgi:hypothetical protein
VPDAALVIELERGRSDFPDLLSHEARGVVRVRTQPMVEAAIRQQPWRKDPAKLEGASFASGGGVSSSSL